MSFPGAGRTGPAETPAGTAWDRQAGGYHRFFSQFTIPVARPPMDAARVTAGSTVLDAGAGPGYAARAARARGAHVVAGFCLPHLADPAAGTAELARTLAPGGWLAVSAWDVPARARHTGLLAGAIAEVTGTPPAASAVPGSRLGELLHASGLDHAECGTLRRMHPVPRLSGTACWPARWPLRPLSCAPGPPPSTASTNTS